MFSVIDRWARSGCDWRAEALEGFLTGLGIGLAITFGIGAAAVVCGHFCIIPFAPWCGW